MKSASQAGCCRHNSGVRGLDIVKTHESCLQGIARPQASSVCRDPQLQRRQGIVGNGLSSASQPGNSKHSPQFSWCAVAEPSIAPLVPSAPCALPLRPAFLPYRSSLSSGRSGRALCAKSRLIALAGCSGLLVYHLPVSAPCVPHNCRYLYYVWKAKKGLKQVQYTAVRVVSMVVNMQVCGPHWHVSHPPSTMFCPLCLAGQLPCAPCIQSSRAVCTFR